MSKKKQPAFDGASNIGVDKDILILVNGKIFHPWGGLAQEIRQLAKAQQAGNGGTKGDEVAHACAHA